MAWLVWLTRPSQHFCRRELRHATGGRDRAGALSPHGRGTGLPTRLGATPRFAAAEPPGIRGLWPRFVDGETAPPKLIFIQLCDRLLCLVIAAHLNERKPARPPRGRVAHHVHRFHGAGTSEQVLELRFAGFIREISDIQLSTHDLTPLSRNATSTPPRRRTVSTASKG